RVDRPIGDAIIAAVRAEFPDLELANRCGELTLKQSVTALTKSEEFWGIDSSLLHLARLIGLRCTSYWGPTNPSFLLRNTWTVDEKVHYRKIACSPCVHTSEEPPCHGDNRCIQNLFQLSPSPSAPNNWTPIEHPPERARKPA
ncbi:MAG: glycosyltransferase family 9 protein, partial [bacterium]